MPGIRACLQVHRAITTSAQTWDCRVCGVSTITTLLLTDVVTL